MVFLNLFGATIICPYLLSLYVAVQIFCLTSPRVYHRRKSCIFESRICSFICILFAYEYMGYMLEKDNKYRWWTKLR